MIEPEKDLADGRRRLGETLRELRRSRRWSLAEASSQIGIPSSTLSRVENGKLSLTYDKLLLISERLGTDLGSLLSDQKRASASIGNGVNGEKVAILGRRSINRAGAGDVVDTAIYSDIYLATELRGKMMTPMIGECRARSIEEFGDWIRHPGEEFTFIVEGELEFHSELYEPVRLKAGDSVYFDAAVGHAYINVGEVPCRMLTVCTQSGAEVPRRCADQATAPIR